MLASAKSSSPEALHKYYQLNSLHEDIGFLTTTSKRERLEKMGLSQICNDYLLCIRNMPYIVLLVLHLCVIFVKWIALNTNVFSL